MQFTPDRGRRPCQGLLTGIHLNVHFHMLFPDGVYVERPDGPLRFRWGTAPTSVELAGLTPNLPQRFGRYLEH